jgi:hypothetical protein
MHWPYFAFADFLGNIYVLNCFDPDVLHRIPLDQSKQHLQDMVGSDLRICATFITPELNLFVLAYRNQLYELYKFNLDQKLNSFCVD